MEAKRKQYRDAILKKEQNIHTERTRRKQEITTQRL